MINYDEAQEEAVAKGGTYDIQGTGAIATKKIWGFIAGDTTVIEAISGVPIGTESPTAVSVLSMISNDATKALFTGQIYRVPGYVITSVKLTSGSLHCFLTGDQTL